MLVQYDKAKWDYDRWPNFTPKELSCMCKFCRGELYFDEQSFDAIQMLRHLVERVVFINSGHRCIAHNKLVGGVKQSEHLKMAFDVALAGHVHKNLLKSAVQAGFTGIGLYSTFIHLDLGRKRHWFGGGSAPQIWIPVLNGVNL